MPCVFVRESGVPTPSRHDNLDDFIDLRDSMRHDRIGSGGREVCAALTAGMDNAVARLVSPLPDGVAIVAVGGYGREELSPFSDVDLMILHDGEDASEIAAELFRPLWDAKLRVGHSVRTLREATAAAKERFDTQTTLLTGRLVLGDQRLYDDLMTQVAAVTKARPLRRHLVAEERRRRSEAPYPLMAANVKEGRGGLRTLQGFEWERRREDLIGRFSGDPSDGEDEAHEVLLSIRNGLHVVAGRSHDEFSTDLRHPVAKWLGRDTYDVAHALVSANQTVERLAESRWPEIVDEPSGRRGKRMWARLTGHPKHVDTTEAPTLTDLDWILQNGDRGRMAFEHLWVDRKLDDLLPEWDFVRCEPQLAPFHEHPVDVHLWRTVEEMRQLVSDGGKYQRVARDVDGPTELLLAAFLHDIGKGHGGDHSDVGADITESFCRRLDISPETTDLLSGAVRHHLLLAETATRRDLDDPAVIDEIADTLAGDRLLNVVYLLTIADSRATGPTMWNAWKSTLLDTLHERCLARLARGRVDVSATKEEVLTLADGARRESAEDHVDRMPEDYLRSTSAADVLWHLELIETRSDAPNVGLRQGDPVDTAVVVGADSDGFRRKVAESFAANGIDVLEARMFTRSDGVVVDSFQVRDDRSGGRVRDDRWARARHDLEAAVRGDLDPSSKVEARASSYPSPSDRQPRADCTVDPATGDLVVAVRCSDRIGRLAEILTVLSEAGLEIRLAKLDGRGDELVDTFHVRSGAEAMSPDSLDKLARRIAGSISP